MLGGEIASAVKAIIRPFMRLVFGAYAVYWVYARETCALDDVDAASQAVPDVVRLDAADIHASLDRVIREQEGYAGEGAYGYAYRERGRIVAVCFYWFGERYKTRGFWPLEDRDAKLVQIVAVPDVRGRGIASTLIATSSLDMFKRDFDRLYARIWHSNRPSLRVFEKAGWSRVALVFEMNPLRRSHPIRLRFYRGRRRG